MYKQTNQHLMTTLPYSTLT